MNKTNVIVIGAGLTGLTTAFYLKKRGIPFIVLEKNDQTGGVIQTRHEKGFTYETGPNTGVIGNAEVAELFEDIKDSCQLETANPQAKRRLIWKKGRWEALPSGPISAISTPLFRMRDKIRILGEPFRKKGDNPYEDVASMVRRRLGKSFLDYAVDPFISGVYAGDPSTLVTQFALPKLYCLEQDYGSFIKGSLQKRPDPNDLRAKKATREVFSAEGGLHNVIQSMVQFIGEDNIHLSVSDLTVKPDNGGYITSYMHNGASVEVSASHVITTIGAHALPEILTFLNTTDLSPITCLRYARVIQAIAGYSHWDGADIHAFGGLVPSCEKRSVLGILFTSSFFKDRAPKDGALLSVFMGGMRNPHMISLSKDQIQDIVLQEIKQLLHPSHLPDLLEIFTYPHAIPQYERSSEERLLCIKNLQEKYPGLILAGNIRDGIGMADRIKQGRTLAEQIPWTVQ